MITRAKRFVPTSIKIALKECYRQQFLVRGRQKIFCIGRNKTGTTSLAAAMTELGFVAGNQRKAELLIEDWAKRDFSRIIQYCRTGQFFQDLPFSLSYTYVVLDHAYKGSKFILTVRDSSEQWYDSLTRFHTKLWGKEGRIPTKEDLENATFISKGRPWLMKTFIYNTPSDDPYNKEMLIEHYNNYNAGVIEYFRFRPNDLLILNVAEPGAYRKLTEFLGIEAVDREFPWKNRS